MPPLWSSPCRESSLTERTPKRIRAASLGIDFPDLHLAAFAQAKSATLVWVVSGDHYAKKRVEPYMVPAMGKKILDVGSNVERAAAFKLSESAFFFTGTGEQDCSSYFTPLFPSCVCAAGNFLLLGILETLAEALTLADKCGVGADLLMEFVKVRFSLRFHLSVVFLGHSEGYYGNVVRGRARSIPNVSFPTPRGTGPRADHLPSFPQEELPSPAYIRCTSTSSSCPADPSIFADIAALLTSPLLRCSPDGTRMQTSIFDGDSGFTVEGSSSPSNFLGITAHQANTSIPGGLKDANHVRSPPSPSSLTPI